MSSAGARHRSVVWPVRVDPSGRVGPTRAEARGPRWATTSRGLYVPSDVDLDDVDQRIATAGPLLGEFEAVTGWAALRWRGARWFSGADANGGHLPVPLLVASRRVAQAGFSVSQEHLRPDEIEVIDGLPVTSVARSVCFEMRHAQTWRQAVVAFDMAAYDDLASIPEILAYAGTLGTWTGIPQCRQALAHVEENSWSPQETRMRLAWTEDGGLPRPLANRPVFDLAGNHLGTPDLIDADRGVPGDYDGSLHLAGERRAEDIVREERFRSVGLELVVHTAADPQGVDGFLGRLRRAYRRAAQQDPSKRTWTLTPPPWWVDTTTVEARRRLTDQQAARLLAYRAG